MPCLFPSQDKDSKIVFLQKAIDVVMLVSGEPLGAKPARIVAGHEPEKTNELLQVMAKCCINKVCVLGNAHRQKRSIAKAHFPILSCPQSPIIQMIYLEKKLFPIVFYF